MFAATSLGKDFYVAIPETFGFSMKAEIMIGTTVDSASYSVESPAGEIAKGDVSYDTPAKVDIDIDMTVKNSEYGNRKKAIHVRATGKKLIYVIVAVYQPAGFGSYLAYPTTTLLGPIYKYYAVSSSTQLTVKSQVLLVSYLDVKVTITPTKAISLPKDAQDPSSQLVDIGPGDSHILKLKPMQTLLISTTEADLTGTLIKSNQPLTVLSGHACGNVPRPYGFCELLTVQIHPTFTWGYEFLLAPFAGRTGDQYYKVVSQNTDTTVLYKCGDDATLTIVLENPGDSYVIRSGDSEYCYLVTNKRLLTVQMATGGDTSTGGDGKGDPAIALVSPVQHHIGTTSFTTLKDDQFSTHAISVTVKADLFRSLDILLDGTPVECEWKAIKNHDDCVAGYGCTQEVLHGSHTVSHNGDGGLLSVMVYGFNPSPERGYAYLAGMDVKRVFKADSTYAHD